MFFLQPTGQSKLVNDISTCDLHAIWTWKEKKEKKIKESESEAEIVSLQDKIDELYQNATIESVDIDWDFFWDETFYEAVFQLIQKSV